MTEKSSDETKCENERLYSKYYINGHPWNFIPKSQKRHLSQCPKCKKKFYYWQYASKHAKEKNHWGDYNV